MILSYNGIQERAAWAAAGITLPAYDVVSVAKHTREYPTWVHFGAGNIFRAFLANLSDRMLALGLTDTGIIACETYDPEIPAAAYAPYDNLSLLCVLNPDGEIALKVLGSVVEAIPGDAEGLVRMGTVFENPSLQMVSFTVTEKAYTAQNPLMQTLCTLLYQRYTVCAAPLALVSMDNCSHNGEKLMRAVQSYVDAKGDAAFSTYFSEKVAFPNTMIDKITPHPSAAVVNLLTEKGFVNTAITHTGKGTVTAAFVNAEPAEYLVIEDRFPNGRPPLEQVGVLFCDAETVDKVEKMKVGTCLNPLHTALAVLGMLLGYTKVSDEMQDQDLVAFVKKLAYVESLPVVEDPGILSPKAFLDEVVNRRIPNAFLPDTPLRIAEDTSHKIAVRFGHTLKATKDPTTLVCVPFVLAAWLRYMTGIDDEGNPFTPSMDPLLSSIQGRMAGGLSDELLSDASLFGADLVQIGLADTVRTVFTQLMEGPGAVRRGLQAVIS